MSAAMTRGERFADAVRAEFDLGLDEQELLEEACRVLDLLDDLNAVLHRDGLTTSGPKGPALHPAVAESRAARLVFVRILNGLGLALADVPEGETPPSPTSARASRAARLRWAHARTVAERRLGAADAPA